MTKQMKKQQEVSIRNRSSYELQERLDALYQIKNRLYDYRHVFNHEDGEPILDIIADEITLTVQTLEERENQYYEANEKRN
jgi:hypothetical protein